MAWLRRLPYSVQDLESRWSLKISEPFDHSEASCAWVAPATRKDGTSAVLKLAMPHFEGEHELHALRFWNGDGAVRLLNADERLNAMLLERCEPGNSLRALPEPEQDEIVATLLRRLWRLPPETYAFRPLSAMTQYWSQETLADQQHWSDEGLVREGLRLFEELPRTASVHVLLATDLHAGNVLRSRREPWLAIDPKPFVGDPAYDATQHLMNCLPRLASDPKATIRWFANLLNVKEERVRLWMFARAAAEPRSNWREDRLQPIAQALRP